MNFFHLLSAAESQILSGNCYSGITKLDQKKKKKVNTFYDMSLELENFEVSGQDIFPS